MAILWDFIEQTSATCSICRHPDLPVVQLHWDGTTWYSCRPCEEDRLRYL